MHLISTSIARLSSRPTSDLAHGCATRGVAAVRGGRAAEFDFRATLLAGHGLSCLLVARAADGRRRTLLFDAGPQRALWRTNAERLGVRASEIEAVVLSHWHVDHSGGLPEVAAMIAEGRRAAAAAAAAPPPPAVFDVHPRRPRRRGLLGGGGALVPLNADPEVRELEAEGATVAQRHAEPHVLCGCFYVSGEIPRTTRHGVEMLAICYELGDPSSIAQWEEGGPWERDPLVLDERFVAVRVRGRGAVVFSACSHAGVVNVMRAAAAAAGGAPPYAVVGGLHLSTADVLDRIPQTVADVAALSPALVAAGHCTGWRVHAALQAALAGRCMPVSVGSAYKFTAPAGVEEEGAGGGGSAA
eukprot:scaffold1.g5534.t1